MRSLAPSETLVYLEAGNLGEALQTLTQNKAWENSGAEKPDFAPLNDIQIAVAVTGFETSEKQLTQESAILNFKPHFVLIADTHAWKPTAVSIVENQIGKFARKTYGDDVKLEKSEKRDAQFFVWTGQDNRKLFSAVSKSVIYVGNDESLLDKCLAVQRGDAENLLKNENLARARETGGENGLAFGYITPEGAAQIANMISVSIALETSEEDAVRSFVARVLPGVLQKTAKEIVWTARKSEEGIEDKIIVKTDGEVSSIFKETIVPATDNQFQTAEFLPLQFNSITRYNLQNPQIAWRSLLLVTSKQMEPVYSKILFQASNSFFDESYGISDGEGFLSAIGTEIITARFDEDGEKSIVIVAVKDFEKVKKSISGEINFKIKPEKIGAADVWHSEDESLAAAFTEGKLILGEKESVLTCLKAKEDGKNFSKTIQFQSLMKDSSAVAATITKDTETARKIIEMFGKDKEDKNIYTSFYITKTRLIENGFERKTVSDFGLLGTIVEKFGEGN